MFDFDDPKNWSALIVGLLLMALGIIPLLNGWGVISFGLPSFLSNMIPMIATYILALGGILLLIDSFMEDDTLRIISIVISLVIIAAGIIPILNNFGVIGFTIPFLNALVFNILFVLEGLFLTIAAFAMF